MCNRWFENIDTDITAFLSSDRGKNSYADSAYNSDDELLELDISDGNDLQINKRSIHTNNE